MSLRRRRSIWSIKSTKGNWTTWIIFYFLSNSLGAWVFADLLIPYTCHKFCAKIFKDEPRRGRKSWYVWEWKISFKIPKYLRSFPCNCGYKKEFRFSTHLFPLCWFFLLVRHFLSYFTYSWFKIFMQYSKFMAKKNAFLKLHKTLDLIPKALQQWFHWRESSHFPRKEAQRGEEFSSWRYVVTGRGCKLGVAPCYISSCFSLMAIGLCDTSLERLSIKGCFTRREIGTGLIELEFEVKIVLTVFLYLSLSLSFFFF